MNKKILSIVDFANTMQTKNVLTAAQLRKQLQDARALWPFGWY